MTALWKSGIISKNDVCALWEATLTTFARLLFIINCRGSYHPVTIKLWEFGIIRVELVSISLPVTAIMLCAHSFTQRKTLLFRLRWILQSESGITLFWRKNWQKARTFRHLLAFKSSASRSFKVTKEELIGCLSTQPRTSSHQAQMTEKSNSGSTQTKSLGNILQLLATRTTYLAFFLTRKLATWSATLKTEPFEFGIFKQKLNLIVSGNKPIVTGSLTRTKTATWLQVDMTVDLKYLKSTRREFHMVWLMKTW